MFDAVSAMDTDAAHDGKSPRTLTSLVTCVRKADNLPFKKGSTRALAEQADFEHKFTAVRTARGPQLPDFERDDTLPEYDVRDRDPVFLRIVKTFVSAS